MGFGESTLLLECGPRLSRRQRYYAIAAFPCQEVLREFLQNCKNSFVRLFSYAKLAEDTIK